MRSPEQESKHTPGPWTVVNCIYVQSPDGIDVAVTVRHRKSFPWRENARLIAAAPELLEALELLLKWSNPIVSEHAQCVEFAKATVAKAKLKVKNEI